MPKQSPGQALHVIACHRICGYRLFVIPYSLPFPHNSTDRKARSDDSLKNGVPGTVCVSALPLPTQFRLSMTNSLSQRRPGPAPPQFLNSESRTPSPENSGPHPNSITLPSPMMKWWPTGREPGLTTRVPSPRRLLSMRTPTSWMVQLARTMLNSTSLLRMRQSL